MRSFSERFSEKLGRWIDFLSNQIHLKAIKMSVINIIPFMIAIGIYIFIGVVLSNSGINFVDENMKFFPYPVYIFSGIFFIYIAFGIGMNLSEFYNLDQIKGGIFAIFSSLMLIGIQYLEFGNINISIDEFLLIAYFPTIIISLVTVEIYRFASKLNIKRKNQTCIPESVILYMNNIISIGIVILIIIFISYFINIDWINPLNNLGNIIMKFVGSYIGMISIVFSTSLFWMYGMHGVAVIGTIMRPFWIQMLLINGIAYINGSVVPYVATEVFYQWFVWIGGSGCTIGLVILMKYKAKSNHLKDIGKQTINPSFFNINEPVIFGTPVAYNKKIMKPFLLVPLVCGSIAWFAIKIGFVTSPFLLVPWVMPAPIGVFIATGGDFNSLILMLVQLIISIVIYYPFFRLYDKELSLEESKK